MKKSLQSFSTAIPEGFKLSLGWLKDGGQTITPSPDLANAIKAKGRYAKLETTINGCYRSYVDIPVGVQHFSFAGVGTEPVLVSVNQFVPKALKKSDDDLNEQRAFIESSQFVPERDNGYLSSIVKAEALWQVSSLFSDDRSKPPETVISQACAQPYAIACQPAPSALIFNFVDGLPGEIGTIRDLFTNQELNQSMMDTYAPINGDYPIDAGCQLQGQQNKGSAAGIIATGLHDWLRSNYTLPKIDSVLTALDKNLANVAQSPHSLFVLEIAANGNVVVSELFSNPFGTLDVEENQLYATINQPVSIGGRFWNVMCRDEVHNLGTIAGGKHAGQPLPGDPVNWDALNTYADQALIETAASRRMGRIMVSGLQNIDGAIALSGAQLQGENGEKLDRNLRTANFSAGLAAEILITVPRRPLR